MNSMQAQAALAALPIAALNAAYRRAGNGGTATKSQMVQALVAEVVSGRMTVDAIRGGTAAPQVAAQAPAKAPAPQVAGAQVAMLVGEVARLEEQIKRLDGIVTATHLAQVTEATIDAKLAGALQTHQQASQSLRATVATLDARLAQAETAAQAQASQVAQAVASLAPRSEEVAEEVRRSIAQALAPFVSQVREEGREEEVAAAVAGPVSQATALQVFGIDARDSQGREMMFDLYSHPEAPPVEPTYIWTERMVRRLFLAQRTGRNVWLGGPAGTGKTQAMQQFAARTGRLFRRMVFDRTMTREDFLGAMGLASGSTVFQPGPVLEAFTTPGALCLLDEVGMAQPQALSSLNGWLEKGARMAYADKVWNKAHGVLFAAADNSLTQGDQSGRYAGVGGMNVAFADRFSLVVPMTYLDPALEAEALVQHTGCTRALADHVIAALGVCRSQVDSGNIIDAPSIRQAIAFIEACRVLPVDEAWHETIASRQPAESSVALAAVYSAAIDAALIQQEVSK